MPSDSNDLPDLLSTWASVYLGTGRSAADRDHALGAILQAYWANRKGETASEFLGLAVLLVLIDAYRDSRRREEVAAVLVKELSPRIRSIARAVSSGREQADFVDEAVSWVFEPDEQGEPRICKYDPTRGALGAWLWSVLHNAWIDWLRKHNKPPPQDIGEGDVIDPASPVDSALLDREELWRRVAYLPPAMRLAGLVWTGLWWILSPDMQRVCLAAYNSLSGVVKLPSSFPDSVLINCPAKQRRSKLAAAFALSPGRFSVQVHRFLRQLSGGIDPRDPPGVE